MAREVVQLVYKDTRGLEDKTFNYRAWAGLAVISDALTRAGIEVGSRTAGAVSDQIVLASVPSAPSWYSLVAEWTRANPTGAVLIVGGPGVLNVRPFLNLPGTVVFQLGRGEDHIVPLVEALQNGERYYHDSIIYADEFDVSGRYRIETGQHLYPYPVKLLNGQTWQEQAVGCRFLCYFCNYTWTRRPLQEDLSYAPQISDRGAVIAGASNLREHNLSELVSAWRKGQALGGGSYINSAIDGQSERIRRAVRKPVTQGMVVDAARLAPDNTRFSLMSVVGFPTETPEDRLEAIEDLKRGLTRRTSTRAWSVEISPNSFRPMPATPAALWPTQVMNWTRVIQEEWGYGVMGHRYWVYQVPGTSIGLKTAWGIGNAHHQLLDLIALRGTEADYENIVRLSRTATYWAASSDRRLRILSLAFDVEALAAEYTLDNYPVRYLDGKVPLADMVELGARGLAKLRDQSP